MLARLAPMHRQPPAEAEALYPVLGALRRGGLPGDAGCGGVRLATDDPCLPEWLGALHLDLVL